MQRIKLLAHKRDKKDKPARLRKLGQLPGVLYGHKIEPISVAVDGKEFEKIFKEAGSNQLVEVTIGEKETHNILFHDVQFDHLNRYPVHFDLYAVRMDEKLRTDVPIHFHGEAPASYNHDAIIFKNLETIEIEALPGDLPENFDINLEDLKDIGDAIYVSDIIINISDKIEVLTEASAMIIKADPPRSEEELEALEEAVPVEGSEADLVDSEHGGDADEEESTEEDEDKSAPADEDETQDKSDKNE